MRPGAAGKSPAVPSFLASLESGRLPWDLLHSFPEQDSVERRVGDELVAEVGAFVEARVDPGELDRTGELPAGLLDALQDRGYFRLRNGADLGGLELSDYNAFRVVERVAGWSVAVGQVLAIQNGVGAAALLPALPPGPLRDHVRQRVAGGTLSGFGATEPAGQNNAWPGLTATRTEDGSAYILRGEKLFTGNGTVADLLAVSATVHDGGSRHVGVFFVDTASPGFAVRSALEFMGSKGLPNAALRLDGVRVPAERMLAGEPDDPRFPPMIGAVALLGALYFTGAPALAVARRCLEFSRAFVGRRGIDGRSLGDYDQVQRIVATSLAEVSAVDSVVRWCLLGSGLTDRPYERLLAKNICTTTAWRVVDRTVSLLGGEGFETAGSKLRRGADPLPVERFFRDARGLRVAGNIDFQLDMLAGRQLLARHQLLSTQDERGPRETRGADLSPANRGADLSPANRGADLSPANRGADLSPANREHLDAATDDVRRLARTCRDMARLDPDVLAAREHTLALVGRIAAELFTTCAVLARTSRLASGDAGPSQELADVHAVAARHRLADLWRRLEAADEPDYAKISRHWLTDPTHLREH